MDRLMDAKINVLTNNLFWLPRLIPIRAYVKPVVHFTNSFPSIAVKN